MASSPEAKVKITADDKTKAGIKSAKKGFAGLSKSLGDITKKAGIAAGAMAGLATAFSVKEAFKFETALAEVSTLLEDTSQVEAMGGAIQKLSAEFGAMPTDSVKATYQIISAGAESAAEALNTLTAANKLAVGGVTTVDIAADGLTSVLNAYGDQVDSATSVSDSMFVAMRAGKTTIEQLSMAVGLAAPLASQLGVSFDELVGSTAALTKAGISTSESMTSIRGILVAVAKGAKQSRDAAEEMGLDFSVAALKAKGLAGFLKDVQEATGGNVEKMAKLFGRVEALSGVLALTGNQAEDFANILGGMKDKAGETEKAFDKMSKTSQFQLNQLKATSLNLATQFGETLLPSVNTLMSAFLQAAEPDGGISVFEEALFVSQKAAAAFAESLTTVAIGLVQVARFNPTTGAFLLFSDKDEKLLEQLRENLASIQDFGTEVAQNEQDLLMHRQAVDEDSDALIGNSQASDKAGKGMEDFSAAALGALDNVTGEVAQEKVVKYWAQHDLGLSNTIPQWQVLTQVVQNYSEELEEAQKDAEELDDVAQDLGFTFSSAFEDAVIGGKDLRGVLSGIFDDIAKIILRKTVTEPLAGFIGSLDFSGMFGGGKAAGGPVSPGKIFEVGEQGPELFVPKTAGTIIPNNKLGGNSTVININIDSSGNSDEGSNTSSEQLELGRRIANVVREVISTEQRPGGVLA